MGKLSYVYPIETGAADDHRRAAIAEALRGHDHRPRRHLRAVTDDAAKFCLEDAVTKGEMASFVNAAQQAPTN